MYRVLIYRGSCNLGDAIQTYAMARLLPPPIVGVYRSVANGPADPTATFVVNGWLGDTAPDDPNCLFAGVYVGGRAAEQFSWARTSRFRVGARDAMTRALFAANGVPSDIVGCATMTLPRYSGPRNGVLNVDVGEFATLGYPLLTNTIPVDMCWEDQWRLAQRRLDALRTAELVYTKRLHIVLPCLAFGTPVVVPRAVLAHTFQPERLAMLSDLGIEYDAPFTTDLTPHAQRFRAFLSDALGIAVEPNDDSPVPRPTGGRD